MRMPVMDGYEATREIKAREMGRCADGENFSVPIAPYPQRMPRVPQSRTIIITLTASTLEEERAVALSAGCDDFTRKPFREVDILEVMNKHIGVQYVYDESAYQPDSTQTQTLTLTLEALNALPANCLASLHQTTIDADLHLMLTLIAQIREENEPLANILADLVNNFKFEKLLSLTQSRAV